MSDFETVNIEIDAGVGVLTLNRPDRLNAFNKSMRDEVHAGITALNSNSDVNVCVLAAAGRAFSVGMELTPDMATGFNVRGLILAEYKPALMAIYNAEKPWIAAVNGAAAGIGASYAMVCDLSVMSEEAYYYQAFAAIGLVPDGGASWHLLHTVGRKRAYEMIVSGEKISAEQCRELGLCNRVVATDELLTETISWATELAAKAPLALRYSKEVLNFSQNSSLTDAIVNEAALQQACVLTEDATEGIQAFMEKRAPRWKGR